MSRPTNVLFNMHKVMFAFLYDERYCSYQSRLLEKMTPKYLSLLHFSRNPMLPSFSLTRYSNLRACFPECMTLLFELFNFTRQSFIQPETESRSPWSLEASDQSLTMESDLESSAYNFIVSTDTSGKWLMYILRILFILFKITLTVLRPWLLVDYFGLKMYKINEHGSIVKFYCRIIHFLL